MATLYSYALTNLQDVRENLGLDSGNTSNDNLIIRQINRITDLLESYTGRRFKLTEYDNVEYDAPGIDQLILNQRPITSFDSLEVRDNTLNEDNWETVDSNLYFVDTSAGVIDLNFNATGRWNRYRVSYTAGYDTIPADLAEAAAMIAAYYVTNPTGNVNVIEKQEGGRRIRYGTGLTGLQNLFQQLGVDGTIDSYCNYPVLADK